MKVTSRKVAWFLVIAVVAWFIYASPKSPLEFFDAEARDSEAIRQMRMAAKERVPSGSEELTKLWDDLASCKRRMDRIALLHDIAHNPDRVNASKHWIVDGFYDADEDTKLALHETDENYRELEQEIDRCKQALKNYNGPIPLPAKDMPMDEKLNAAVILRTELEMSSLRQVQAALFWWGGR